MLNLEYIKQYETNFTYDKNNNQVDYKLVYSEHKADLRCIFYVFDKPLELIEQLENNVAADIMKYSKASKAKKTLYAEMLNELNRISLETMGNIQTYEKSNPEIVNGLIKGYDLLLYRSSLFSKALEYIRMLAGIQS